MTAKYNKSEKVIKPHDCKFWFNISIDLALLVSCNMCGFENLLDLNLTFFRVVIYTSLRKQSMILIKSQITKNH